MRAKSSLGFGEMIKKRKLKTICISDNRYYTYYELKITLHIMQFKSSIDAPTDDVTDIPTDADRCQQMP